MIGYNSAFAGITLYHRLIKGYTTHEIKNSTFCFVERKEKLLQENHLQIQHLKEEADKFEAHWKEVHDSEVQECRKRMQKLHVEAPTHTKTSPGLHSGEREEKEACVKKMTTNTSVMAVQSKVQRTSAFASSNLVSVDAPLQNQVVSQPTSSRGRSKEGYVCKEEKTEDVHISSKQASAPPPEGANLKQTSSSAAAGNISATSEMMTTDPQADDVSGSDAPGTSSNGGTGSDPVPVKAAVESSDDRPTCKKSPSGGVMPPKSVRFQLPGEEQ